MHPYKPAENDTKEALLKKAFNCGRDLSPADPRADWIDTYHMIDPSIEDDLINEYHEGQSQQYTAEAW